MSFLSTLDASKLMQAARANLQPLVDNSEDKARRIRSGGHCSDSLEEMVHLGWISGVGYA